MSHFSQTFSEPDARMPSDITTSLVAAVRPGWFSWQIKLELGRKHLAPQRRLAGLESLALAQRLPVGRDELAPGPLHVAQETLPIVVALGPITVPARSLRRSSGRAKPCSGRCFGVPAGRRGVPAGGPCRPRKRRRPETRFATPNRWTSSAARRSAAGGNGPISTCRPGRRRSPARADTRPGSRAATNSAAASLSGNGMSCRASARRKAMSCFNSDVAVSCQPAGRKSFARFQAGQEGGRLAGRAGRGRRLGPALDQRLGGPTEGLGDRGRPQPRPLLRRRCPYRPAAARPSPRSASAGRPCRRAIG